VPEEFVDQVQPVGVPNVRAWGGSHSKLFLDSIAESVQQAHRAKPGGWVDKDGAASILTISGGGANGAYGAGLLCGWTDAGTRPTFKLVTGISTGALMAPFAFLGSEYDDELKELYTTITSDDIFKQRSMLTILGGTDAMTDTKPLAKLIAENATDEVFEAIAVEHEKGRRLYIGTTNLDARKLMVWDMGAIAAQRSPEAQQLFMDIMRASASIPVAFPPIYMKVRAPDGEVYDEMHVDGGVTTQVFMYGAMFQLDDVARKTGFSDPKIKLYIIRNSQIRVFWKEVEPRILPIAAGAVGKMIASSGLGDVYRIYTFAERDGIDFNLAAIPNDFVPNAQETFDEVEMNRLFDLGYGLAVKGYPWQKEPPGMDTEIQPGDE